MRTLDLFNSTFEQRLHKGAVDTNECMGYGGLTSEEKLAEYQDTAPGHDADKTTLQPEQGVVEGWDESDNEEESNLHSGSYVRDREDPSGEVFVMRGDASERRVQIQDRNGSGWNISPSRLIAVDANDPAIARYFGKQGVAEDGERKTTHGTEVTDLDDQGRNRITHTRKYADDAKIAAAADKKNITEDQLDRLLRSEARIDKLSPKALQDYVDDAQQNFNEIDRLAKSEQMGNYKQRKAAEPGDEYYHPDHWTTTSQDKRVAGLEKARARGVVPSKPNFGKNISQSERDREDSRTSRGMMREQGVAEGSEEKYDFIPVKLLKRNVPYWLTYDFYGHGGKLVKLSGPDPTNNNFIVVKDQDGNKYRLSKKAVLFASDPNQNKGREQGVTEGLGQDYLSQIPNLSWEPVSRNVWHIIQYEGLDEEQDTPRRRDWVMASLSIDPKDAQALMAFEHDAIEDFNRFDIHLKSRYPGLTDLIDYDRGTVTIVKTINKQGVAEGVTQQIVEYTIRNMNRDGYEFFAGDYNGFDKCWTKEKGGRIVNDCRPVKKKRNTP